MKSNWVFVVSACLLLIMVWANTLLAECENTGKPSKAEVMQRTKKLQMPFIANEGQLDERVAFYARTFGGTVFVTKGGDIVYSLPMVAHASPLEQGETQRAASVETQYLASLTHSPNAIFPLKRGTRPLIPYREGINGVCNTTPIPNDKNETHPRPLLLEGRTGIALHEEFVGAMVSGIKGEGESVTKVSYFKGNDPSRWKSNIATYQLVNLGEIYKGIELKLKAHGNNVEKLLYVKPGAVPEQIKISLSGMQSSENPPPLSTSVRGTDGCPPLAGAGGLFVNEHGELVAETGLGPVKFTKPIAYQEIDGKRVDVAVEYSIQNPEDVGWVKRSAPNRNGLNQSNGLEASGKRQIISGEKGMGRKGKYLATNLKPPTSNPKSAIVRLSNHDEVQNPKSEYGFKVASYDKTKELVIDPLLASTFLGGDSSDLGSKIVTDSVGNVYVAGQTLSADFPTTIGAYDTSYNGGNLGDAFVSKLNGDLTRLLASTYLGGSADDFAYSLAINTNGSICVAGWTRSTDFATTSDAYDTSSNGGLDAFISILNSDLTSLLASTYLGGSQDDNGEAISMSLSEKNIYIVGRTSSTNFPTTSAAYDISHNGGIDTFVSILSSDLKSLLASTYLGGNKDDLGGHIAIKTDGNIYVAGATFSGNFPTTAGAYNTLNDGGSDAFVSKLNNDLKSLLASTYLGGIADDYGGSVIIDSTENVYVYTLTYSSNFPASAGAYDTSHNGSLDSTISKLDGNLTNILASTYIGGSDADRVSIMSMDASGDIYVIGQTNSINFPTTPEAYDISFNGGDDAFVSKLNGNLTNLLASTYLGGSGADSGSSIATNSDGNIYVTGWTNSTNFPSTPGAFDASHNTDDDIFISKFDSGLSANPMKAPYVSPKIIVDGNVSEGAWDIATDVSKTVIGTTNNTTMFGVLWDTTYLYVGMKVLDDTLYNDSTYVHEDDSVEIYIDGDHNHGTTYDNYDRQFVKGWFDSALVEQHGKTTGVLHGWAPISGGYSIELAIPWSNLGITPTAGMTIGFSVGYNDDDNGAGRDGQAVWIGTANNYLDTSALGDIVLGADPNLMAVPYTSSSLTVDGNVSEGDWNIATDVSKTVIGTTNNTTTFGVLWDTTYLYVGMKVLDDTLYNDSMYVHEDDSVEIYIDGDHNHGTTYDNYDRQFVKGWFDSTLVEQHGKTTGVLHGWAPISGGYSIELAIPWSNLGITPSAGMTIGFSVGYNDDDNGAGRDGQAVWIGTANNWLDTSAFGSIILGAASPPTPTPTSTSTPPSPTPTPAYTPTNTPTPPPSPTPIVTPPLTPTPTPTPLPGGLNALYTLNEGSGAIANDSSGNGNHGTINGAAWTTGISGGALSLDGVNDYVDLGNPANLQPGTVSLSVWFKTTATGGRIVRKRTYGYGLDVLPTGKISFWINNAAAARFTATSPNAYNDNAWHHAVGVYGGSMVKLYIDGFQVASASAGAIFYGAGAIAIGRDGDYNGSYFKGLIDDVRIFQNELSAQEVLDLYNQASSGLVSHWKLDEGSGTHATDSADGNNGVINGATWTTGISGGALSLDGVNDYVDLGNPENLQPGTVSLSVWFKTTATGGRIVRKRTYGYGLDVLPTGKISFWINNAAAARFTATSPNAYNDNTWHHAVGVYGGSLVKLYIDGSQVASANAGTIFYGAGAIAIGRDGDYNGSYFKGLVDDVRIFQSELSTQAVLDLYNQSSSGLVSQWKFDEGIGTIANDWVDGNNGAINGATWTAGKSGSALGLDGNDYVQIPGLLGQPQNITLSAWVQLNAKDTLGAEVISLGDHVTIRLDGSNGAKGFYYDGTTWRGTDTGLSYAGTGWHHVVYVVDDNNNIQKVYVDGIEKGSTVHTQSISYTGLGSNTFIGRHGNSGGNYDFAGIIDDARVYNKALNAQEVQGLYNSVSALATTASHGFVAIDNGDTYTTVTPPGTVMPMHSTTVIISSFKAEADDGRVILTWETSEETSNAGFNLYRSRRRNGTYTQVNNALIDARGDAVSGGSYSFEDQPGKGNFYYYKLESVDYDGVSTVCGSVKVQVRSEDNPKRRSKRHRP